MRIIVGFEYSQVVTREFRRLGHNAFSCDLLPTEGNPAWHIQDDVRNHLNDGWDMGIFHDPCTVQCNSGVRWLHEIPGRWEKLKESCELTREIFACDIPLKCRENPIPHKYALELIGIPYTQCVQPHYFVGSNESKNTCLWLFGLPKLQRNQWLPKSEIRQSIWKMPPGPDRGKERSRFPVSIARAMAYTWGYGSQLSLL